MESRRYTNGFGWGAEFKDYASFHGRMIARTVNVGTPQVTAKVVTLEDLRDVPAGFLEAGETVEDFQPVQTKPIDEISLRKNLLQTSAAAWPSVQDGPLEGNVTTWIVIDRKGKVREIDGIVSENSAMNETGKDAVMRMQFRPFLVDGAPIQVLSQFTLPFKTTRPTRSEKFDSAQTCFERGRRAGFPSAGTGGPYVMRAQFELRNSAGEIEKGRREDTWLSDMQWRREAWFPDSHLVRSRSDEKRYRLLEGQKAGVKVARSIDVSKDGNLLMRIHVTEISPAGSFPDSKCKLPGHEWKRIFTGSHTIERQFTDEVR